MSIKAVIFDLDDTLISERQYIMSGFRAVSQAVEDRFGIDRLHVYDMLDHLFKEDTKLVFNRMFNRFGIDYQEKDIRWLIDLYRDHEPEIDFFDDVIPFLKYLKQIGLMTGIISDGYKTVQRKKMRALNAEAWFDHIIVTDELGRNFWKPNPQAFKLMAETLGVHYEQMMYIGDNPEKDFYISTTYPVLTVRIMRDGSIYRTKPYFNGVREKYRVKSLCELNVINMCK